MSPPGALGARHPDVERLRRLLRRRADRVDERAFVLEGPKLLAEAIAAGAPIEAVFVAEDAAPLDLPVDDVRVLRKGLLERVADTVSPQPVLAVCRTLDVALDAVADATFVVVAHDVQDPGNAGTILRSADASGAGGVVFTATSVDPYNPKTVRASAGSLFHVPVVRGVQTSAAIEELRQLGRVADPMAGLQPLQHLQLERLDDQQVHRGECPALLCALGYALPLRRGPVRGERACKNGPNGSRRDCK